MRRLLGLVAAAAALLGLLAPATYADPVVDHWSSVTVTRLTLAGGSGTLHVRIDIRTAAWNGFIVALDQSFDVPTWSGPADVVIPGTAVHCRRGLEAGYYPAAMVYHCGEAGPYEPATVLPVGSYAVDIPVTGGVPSGYRSTSGRVSLWSDHLGSVPVDTFPVYDDRGPRSTVESKVARLRPTATGWTATVSAEVAVQAADQVTEVDVPLGDAAWRLLGTDAPGLGYRASLAPQVAGSSYLVLRYTPALGATYLPTGTVQLTSRLAVDGPFGYGQDPNGQTSQVELHYAGSRVAWDVDTFAWRPEY